MNICRKTVFAMIRTAVLLCCLLADSTHADPVSTGSPERIVWRRTPVHIPLVTGQERLVHFTGSVSVGVPQSLTAVLRSQSINGTLYLLATRPFSKTRVLVRSESDGPIYAIDLSAQPSETTEPGEPNQPRLPEVHIILDHPAGDGSTSPGDSRGNAADANGSDSLLAITRRQSAAPGYVALTRHAAQQLYAPARLLEIKPGVVRLPIADGSVALVRGGGIDASPVRSWKAGRLYITAVQLTNLGSAPVVLDPRQLRGAWLTATFQHNRLHRAGSDADATAVYLISDRPFAVALDNG